ncbi:MAG TPA: electron transfer flavoprotein-ubiquinone oxidoreductase [Terriglobia bacterium]|nr:electron transfer flavoprotein-ubiquinone oxidoreductase [Terriglobia bacterium]
MPERETLETDVLIVGAGPAGLSCALRLADLYKRRFPNPGATSALAPSDASELALSPENIFVIEKASEIGGHALSGALLDPKALEELIPGFQSEGAPLQTPVTADSVLYLTGRGRFSLPITPPFLRNHGNYVISLNQFVKWLGERAEQAGVSVFSGFAGMEVLYHRQRVIGVRTGDKGVERNGQPKANYQPGYDLRAKITIFAEGTRGSLAKQVIAKMGLDRDRNPQTYALGVKELWEVPAGRIRKGEVIHTAGWPLTSHQYGGGFIYAISENQLSLGFVAGLDYEDARFDPHHVFQEWKTHPWLKSLLDGGQMVRYGAKTLPEGGYFSIPDTATDGAMFIGDAAGFLNAQRLKGIHLAMKTGMLAAEVAFAALLKSDYSRGRLAEFENSWKQSWVGNELWKVRNYHQGFQNGFWLGGVNAALQLITGGRGLRARITSRPDYEHMKQITKAADAKPEPFKPDGKLTFDKLADVYHSGTHHEEDQPSHLRIADFDICNRRCAVEFGNPCQHFCPAAVYEMEDNSDGSGKHLKLNPSNCVHCKTCDIQDPYQIITWVCPEGGGGPRYDGL